MNIKHLSNIKRLVLLAGLSTAMFSSQASFSQTNDEFVSALISTFASRVSYAEYWENYGEAPQSIADIGYAESDFQNELVEHAGISSETGAILIGLDNRFGDKQWAAFIPQIGSNGVNWVCQTTVSSAIASGSGCQSQLSYSRVDVLLDTEAFNAALLVSSALKNVYAESYRDNGEIPTSSEQLGIEQGSLEQGNISHVMVDPNTKAMIIGLDNEVFGINQWLSFSPIINRQGNLVRWVCRTTLPRKLVETYKCSADEPLERMLFSILTRRGLSQR